MKKIAVIVSLTFLFLIGTHGVAFATSEVKFPDDWKSWKPVLTPLAEIGALPGCDADVSYMPQIYQDTVATYCAVKPGGPGKVEVLVKPEAARAYKAKDGRFADGSNFVLHLVDLRVLFVTGHEGGSAKYGVFTEDGQDVTAASGPLAIDTCRTCHTGYTAFCVGGQCGSEGR